MSESPAPTPIAPGAPEAGGNSAGFFQNLLDVYVSPREAFTRIAARPAWILPAAAYVVLTVIFVGTWMSRMDYREFMQTQIEASGQAERLTAEQREQAIEMQAGFMPVMLGLSGTLGPVVSLLVVAGLLLAIYRFFYAASVTWPQSLAVTSWVFFATGLVSTPLLLAVMGLKGYWNLNPQDALQTSLALLVDKATTAKPLYALLGSIDLFSIWIVFLLATGYAAVIRRSTSSALWGVVVPWALVVLAKVVWAAIF